MTDVRVFRSAVVLLAAAGAALSSHAQDSVASAPGGNDAFSAYGNQRAAYVVDLVEVTSRWGNPILVAPIAKASVDPDPMFRTHLLGSSAISSDLRAGVLNSTSYALWSSPGQGINASANTGFDSVEQPVSFDASFSAAFTDLSGSATNAFTTLIGMNADEPNRLYVERVMSASSRPNASSPDASTIAVGGVNAEGLLSLRADAFNTLAANAINGDNIIRVDVPARSAAVNNLFRSGTTNTATNSAATLYAISRSSTPLNTPVSTNSLFPLSFDFASELRSVGTTGQTNHLDSSVTAHRGNPSFAAITNPLGADGVGASLAQSVSGQTDSINLFGIDDEPASSFSIQSTDSAAIPSPLMADGVTYNDARFINYLSQEGFRGPSGQVGIGFDPDFDGGSLTASATAIDSVNLPFIPVAKFGASGTAWDVVARANMIFTDQPGGGTNVGLIRIATAATFSAPAVDSLGNVYFIANFQKFIEEGGLQRGFFRANNLPGGYELELLLEEGQEIEGANSGTTYTIESLTLGDADSLASGSFHGGSMLHEALPGREDGFGGLIVNARLSYDRGGTPETYDAALFVTLPAADVPACEGDANGDSMVTIADVLFIIARFGDPAPSDADVNGDNAVTIADVLFSIARFGNDCQ